MVLNKIFRRLQDKFSKLEDLPPEIRTALSDKQEQFDDHLDAINENTNEIQANYEYLCKIEAKIDKLCERIDELSMFLQQRAPASERYHVQQLTKHESSVFMAVYMLTDDEEFITYRQIARQLGLTEQLVSSYVTSLIEKGIPVFKKYMNNEVFLTLDKDFKAVQAKENILGVTPVVSLP